MLTPGDPGYPGSPFDALLALDGDALEPGALLVEAPGPVGLVSGVPADRPLPERAVRVDDVLVLARDGGAVAARLGEEVPERLRALAGTTAPLAWAGATGLGDVLVSQDGAAVRVEVDEEVAAQVEQALAGSVPGSPGRRWSALLAGAEVREEGGVTVLEATATDALPPTLLRQLVDQAALPPH